MTRWLVAIGSVVALSAVGAFALQQTLAQPDLTSDSAAYGLRFVAELDQDYTFTKGYLRNDSGRAIQLRDVRVGSITPGLALLGFRVAAVDRFDGIPLVFGPGFPPPEVAASDVSLVTGYTVEPGSLVRLLVGLRVTSPGIHEVASITVDYGHSLFGRSTQFSYLIRVCAPSADYLGDGGIVVGCPVPDPPQP